MHPLKFPVTMNSKSTKSTAKRFIMTTNFPYSLQFLWFNLKSTNSKLTLKDMERSDLPCLLLVTLISIWLCPWPMVWKTVQFSCFVSEMHISCQCYCWVIQYKNMNRFFEISSSLNIQYFIFYYVLLSYLSTFIHLTYHCKCNAKEELHQFNISKIET